MTTADDERVREPLLPDHIIPRFITERPRSFEDCWLYALEATYTAEDSGSPRRWGHVLWTWGVTLPSWLVAHFVIWVTEWPGRGIPFFALGIVVSSGLNGWALVAWLVPDWWTIPYWVSTVTGWWAA